jgi:hypothetical protein
MPDIVSDPPEARWKRGPVIEVETQDEVDELVVRGGVVVLEDETPAVATDAPAPTKPPKGGAKGGKK